MPEYVKGSTTNLPRFTRGERVVQWRPEINSLLPVRNKRVPVTYRMLESVGTPGGIINRSRPASGTVSASLITKFSGHFEMPSRHHSAEPGNPIT